MKKVLFLVTMVLSSLVHAEDWKGTTPPEGIQLGAMTGLGLSGNQAGLSLIAQASKRIVERGFVPDLNDSVWFEVQAGWILFTTPAPFVYSAHLRWDFIKNDQWLLYGLAGFGGMASGAAVLFPRTAIGAAMNLASNSPMSIRFELSQSWITTGVTWGF